MGDHYAVVDWMVGDYRLKGAKKYGVMIVEQKNTGWTSIHTYLVDDRIFKWLTGFKKAIVYDVIGEYKGKAYAGKGQSKVQYEVNKNKIDLKFYRINDNYIIPNYPK